MKYAWLLIFLLFLLLCLLVYIRLSSQTGYFVQALEVNTNTRKYGWYFLGKVEVEAGKIVGFDWLG